ELAVRKFLLRVLIQGLHVGVRGGRIKIGVILFDVFRVISFVGGESKEALLQDGIPAVPQSEGKAHQLMAVGNTHDSVFAPAIGTRPRVIVREEIPGGAVRAVVFSDGSPLALGQVWSPAVPMSGAQTRFFEAFFFRVHPRGVKRRMQISPGSARAAVE